MDEGRRAELEAIALEVRKDVVRMVGVARSYGLPEALTAVDLLVCLYWERMKAAPGDRSCADRDRLVLGKGSATPALYACLARLGFFRREELWSYRRLGAMLQGFPDIRTPGVDAPGGARGGGVGIASGLCLAMRLDGIEGPRVFCVMGDEELRAGAAWESILTASGFRLGNLVLLVDADRGEAGEIGALRKKFEAFGWFAAEADGHDFRSLGDTFDGLPDDGRPKAILARTCRGSGISFLERGEAGNARPLSNEEMDRALAQLEASGPGQNRF